MLSFINVQAGLAATGLCLGGFAISAAVALVTAPITPKLAIAKSTEVPSPTRIDFQAVEPAMLQRSLVVPELPLRGALHISGYASRTHESLRDRSQRTGTPD